MVEGDEGVVGARISGRSGVKVATTIYRITNGFASVLNDDDKHMVFVSRHESQTAAFVEVRRLCGVTEQLSKEEELQYYRYMWKRYKRQSYIIPSLTVGILKPGVTVGKIVGRFKASIATQFVVVMDDHDDRGAAVRFPWGVRGWVKPA